MATAAAIEDAITCCICFNVYRDPHALPCLHTLCKPCIDKLAVRGKVECPECREISDVRKIRKDFKTQNLIDAHNGKAGGSGVGEVCGMCREPGKEVNSHCKECDHFMCTGCEKAHNVMKVCRGHTVRAVKDIVQKAMLKLDKCIKQWKTEKNKITTKTNKIELCVKSVQDEAEKQKEITNQHFDKLIHNIEKTHSASMNEMREENEVSVKTLRENKELYDQLSREIQCKIDVLQEVLESKNVSTMDDMVDDINNSFKEQVLQISKQLDNLDGVVPAEKHIDDTIPDIDIPDRDTGIKIERILQQDMVTHNLSLMLYSDFSKLKTNCYQLHQSLSSKDTIYRIWSIENNIWCAAWGSGIKIYDKNMQLIKEITHNKVCSSVRGLTEWHGDIIVACDSDTGLHQMAKSGVCMRKIVNGMFSDISSNGKIVYGLKHEDRLIAMLACEKNKWLEKGEILLKNYNVHVCDQLFVSNKSVFLSLLNESCIQKYSLEGELQQTIGHGRADQHPLILSGVDVYENLLVSDLCTKQLKVYYPEEKMWHVVPLDFDLEGLFDVVLNENNICIVTSKTWHSPKENKLLKTYIKLFSAL